MNPQKIDTVTEYDNDKKATATLDEAFDIAGW